MWNILKERNITFEIESNIYLKFNLLMYEFENKNLFGFSIEKRNEHEILEKESVLNITDCEKTAHMIFNKLVEGLVTPVSLCYIIDDFISEMEMEQV